MHTTDKLLDQLERHRPALVLTGAGVSTESGIPAYRDASGAWQHPKPVLYQEFVASLAVRQRYWARSVVGWPRFDQARANLTHESLARLQQAGVVDKIVTQNVDGLHQHAGSTDVVDLHGRLHEVICLACRETRSRERFQRQLIENNPGFLIEQGLPAPDGDARLKQEKFPDFIVPDCRCGGVLKPHVVFFGESVPRERVLRCQQALREAGALWVIGSSLMVFSGYRFAREAVDQNKPLLILTDGKTRADDIATLKLSKPCTEVVEAVANHFL